MDNAEDITLSPVYNSAVNAVTRPAHGVVCSQYFVDRWMPELGGAGTQIVLALRRLGYLNLKTGERRDEIVISRKVVAERAGISEDTLTRELGEDKKTGLPRNPALRRFVQSRRRHKRDRLGRLLQDDNAYWVSMDDPIHPEDWSQVEEEIRLALERAEKQQTPQPESQVSQPRQQAPETQNASSVISPETQNAFLPPQSAAPETQNAVPRPQNASHLNPESDSFLPLSTSPDAARPGGSLSLFQEQEAVRTWSQLTEAEQQPYRIQAEQELTTLFGFAEWSKIGARAHDRQVCTRAETLYKAAVKEGKG